MKERMKGAKVTLRLDPKGAFARTHNISFYPHFVRLDTKGKKTHEAFSLGAILKTYAKR